MTWDKDKGRILDKLEVLVNEGKVDEGIRPLLDAINCRESYVTTSSCAGRIVLLQVPELGDKKDAVFLGKWHRPISVREAMEALSQPEAAGDEMVFLLVQSPIVHIRCKDIVAAAKMRALGEACGLKYSTIRSLTTADDGSVDRVVVELLGTSSMDMPLGTREKVFPNIEYLEYLTLISNTMFERNKKRFDRLLTELKDPSKPGELAYRSEQTS